MKICLCILTRNEISCLEKTLPLLIEFLKNWQGNCLNTVVAVDGNSTDGTVGLFKKNHIKVLTQTGVGRGAAFHTAFNQIKADAWIFYSPDGNEDISDLPKFVNALYDGADLVIASRMCKGAVNEEDINFWKPRKWVNNIFNVCANLFFRRKGPFVSDSINGYRAVTKNGVDLLNLDAQDYTIEFQMTIRALKNGLNIAEFPTVEGQRIAGDESPSIILGLRFIECLWREIKIGKNLQNE
jgi:glycosyltransferase involved in cell wall biosynthesis